jgi:hypothetical protein
MTKDEMREKNSSDEGRKRYVLGSVRQSNRRFTCFSLLSMLGRK